jgi:hypothetical protein
MRLTRKQLRLLIQEAVGQENLSAKDPYDLSEYGLSSEEVKSIRSMMMVSSDSVNSARVILDSLGIPKEKLLLFFIDVKLSGWNMTGEASLSYSLDVQFGPTKITWSSRSTDAIDPGGIKYRRGRQYMTPEIDIKSAVYGERPSYRDMLAVNTYELIGYGVSAIKNYLVKSPGEYSDIINMPDLDKKLFEIVQYNLDMQQNLYDLLKVAYDEWKDAYDEFEQDRR